MSSTKSLSYLYPRRIDIPILIVLSVTLLILGLSKPIITVKKLWNANTQSVISSINNLWIDKDYGLAAIILFFSIAFPIVKLTSLFWIWYMPLAEQQRKKLIYLMEILGRWSMLDVFVCAVLIVAIKLGSLASAKIEEGIYYFGASIMIAMLVANLQGHLIRKK